MPLPEFKQLVDEARSQINEIGREDLRRMQLSHEDFTLIDVRESVTIAKRHHPQVVGIFELCAWMEKKGASRSLP